MKGQKSLEFVIGLVILLVVAGTVISVFLDQFENDPGDQWEGQIEEQQIQSECNSLCNQYEQRSGSAGRSAALEYCTNRYEADLTDSGNTDEIAGGFTNQYCEDGIHCFNVADCSVGRTNLDADGCEELLREHYTEEVGLPLNSSDPDKRTASKEIASWYNPDETEGNRGIGSCELDEVQVDTWWHLHFKKYFD